MRENDTTTTDASDDDKPMDFGVYLRCPVCHASRLILDFETLTVRCGECQEILSPQSIEHFRSIVQKYLNILDIMR